MPAESYPKGDDELLLQLLLDESGQARDDDRYQLTQLPVLITVALTLIVAMAWIFANTYAVGYPPTECVPKPGVIVAIGQAIGAPTCQLTAIPIWVYFAAPMLPIVLLSYVIVLGTISTLRSYYLRTIEREIHALTRQSDKELPVPSWAHLQLEVTGQIHSGTVSARLNWIWIYAIVFVMGMGSVFTLSFKIPADVGRIRILALAFDALLLTVPALVSMVNVSRGSVTWRHAMANLHERLARTDEKFPIPQPPAGERSLTSFLLLPRNQEELLKALFIPICFLIGRTFSPKAPFSGEMFFHLAGFFFVFEFLFYQARYLLNDVRDRRVDSSKEMSKTRFPRSVVDDQKALRAAYASFLARLAIGGLIVFCLPPIHDREHAGLLLSVFIIALPYEWCRSRCIAAAYTSSGLKTPKGWTLAVIAVVGLGYGLRAVAGLWLAGIGDPRALLLMALGASFFGSMFVALGWALESTRAIKEVLAVRKAHLMWFQDAVSRTTGRPPVTLAPDQKVLTEWQSPISPWCFPAVFATAALAAFALYMLREFVPTRQLAYVGLAVVSTAALSVVIPLKWSRPLVACIGLGSATALSRLSAPPGGSVVAALIMILPSLYTCVARNMCFDDIPKTIGKIVDAMTMILYLPYKWFTEARW